jgi:hypothetical protein
VALREAKDGFVPSRVISFLSFYIRGKEVKRILAAFMVCVLLPSFAYADFSRFKVAQNDRGSLNINDLGFDTQTTQADPNEALVLNKRSKQLHIHQIMGLVTLGLMTATLFTAPDTAPSDDLHKTLGLTTAASYAATAYLSLTAPEPKYESEKGLGMKIHKALLFVHLPGMILTPIAGLMANRQAEKGEKLHGLAKYKKDLAYVTYGSFAAAAISVTFNF